MMLELNPQVVKLVASVAGMSLFIYFLDIQTRAIPYGLEHLLAGIATLWLAYILIPHIE